MEANEFIIKKFERNYPTLVKLIDEWTEHSIEQNWDCVKIILNEYNVPNCPEPNTFNEKHERKSWIYLEDISSKIAEYFFAKGFKRVNRHWPVTLWSPYKIHLSGHCISAYFTDNQDKKKI
jgi:hypothetical protein